MVLTIIFWVCIFLFPEFVSWLNWKYCTPSIHWKAWASYSIACCRFFFFIVYNTKIVKQDSSFELMLYGLNYMDPKHLGPLFCFDSGEGGWPLTVFFFFFKIFLISFNSELKKKTHAKRRRFSGSNGSNNWVVTESWIDKNWKLEDWIDKNES